MKGIAPKNRELLETAGLNDIYKSAEHDTDDLMIKVAEANWNSRIVKQAPPHSNILNDRRAPRTCSRNSTTQAVCQGSCPSDLLEQ